MWKPGKPINRPGSGGTGFGIRPPKNDLIPPRGPGRPRPTPFPMPSRPPAAGPGAVQQIVSTEISSGTSVSLGIIPFMREAEIAFLGYELRTNRRMYHYFDDIDVDNYVARPNIITVRKTNNIDFIDMRQESGEELFAGSNTAKILLTEKFSESNTGYIKLYISPEFVDIGAGVGLKKSRLGFKNIETTKYVSMRNTPTGNSATRTYNYNYESNGTVYIFYNTFRDPNQIEIFRSNGESGVYNSNGEINISSSLVSRVFVANTTHTDSRLPDRFETREYLSIDYTGANSMPSQYIGPDGLGGPLGISDNKRFGIFEFDFEPSKGNTIHVVVGGDKVNAVGGSKAGSPFQFAISLDRANNNSLIYQAVPGQGQNVAGRLSGATGQIVDVNHFSGVARRIPNDDLSKIALDRSASSVDNWYVGNTIYIVNGTGEGQSSNIVSYDGTTKIATVSPTWTLAPTSVSIYSIGTAKSTKNGLLPGIFYLPSNESISFRSGDRLFKMTDSPVNDDTKATSKAQKVFSSTGTRRIIQNTIVIRPAPPPPPRPDPIAQSFFISGTDYPEGIFLESIDVFFATKDDVIPTSLAVKRMVNGYPEENSIPGSDVIVAAEDVNVSNLPRIDDANTATKFRFRAPIHLTPGEYAFVIYSDSREYEVWVAEMGQLHVGTQTRISEQPYLGSMFKSQNDTTWTPFQFEDIMFKMNKCKFTSAEGETYFNNARIPYKTKFDAFTFTMDHIEFGSTSVDYQAQTDQDPYFYITNRERTIFTPDAGSYTRRTVGQDDATFNVKVTMSTTSEHVSPVLDIQRAQLRVVGNIINDGGIYSKDIKITNEGTGYNTAPSVIITAQEGDEGASANAMAVISIDDKVVNLEFDNNGRSYYRTPTVTLSGGSGTGATAEVISEESSSGGNFAARYITRKVTLADGFEAGDLKVYMDAFKPAGTDIAVYYRILNSNDTTPFEERPYILMEQVGQGFEDNTMFMEYEFAPSLTSDRARYSVDDKDNQYRSFKHFAIKIVMKSNFESVYPIIQNLRVMALPEGAS
jgi:hypothetical protein